MIGWMHTAWVGVLAANGHVSWPPRSPDLTPLDYWVYEVVSRAESPLTTSRCSMTVVREVSNITVKERMKGPFDFNRRIRDCAENGDGPFSELISSHS